MFLSQRVGSRRGSRPAFGTLEDIFADDSADEDEEAAAAAAAAERPEDALFASAEDEEAARREAEEEADRRGIRPRPLRELRLSPPPVPPHPPLGIGQR